MTEDNKVTRETAREQIEIAFEALSQLGQTIDTLAEHKDRFSTDHKYASIAVAEALLKLEEVKIHLRKRKRLTPIVSPMEKENE